MARLTAILGLNEFSMISNNDPTFKGCPIQHARQFLSGKWQMGILWNLKSQPLRFGEIKSLLPGLADKTLMEELEFFVENRIVERMISDIPMPKTEYSLSVLGRSLLPIINATVEWGYTHLQDEKIKKEMSSTPLAAIEAIESSLIKVEIAPGL